MSALCCCKPVLTACSHYRRSPLVKLELFISRQKQRRLCLNAGHAPGIGSIFAWLSRKKLDDKSMANAGHFWRARANEHSNPSLLNPRRACAAPVTWSLCVCVCVCLSVCLSVCQQLFSHYRLRGGPWTIPTSSNYANLKKKMGDFPETTTFERCAVKTSQYA